MTTTPPDGHPSAASITVYPDGPLIVRGDFELRDLDGTHRPTGRTVALCRCGRSAAKPLCDGSHRRGALVPDAKPAEREAAQTPTSRPAVHDGVPVSEL